MRRQKYPDHDHGFNLIELLVTLAIASILLAVAVPSMRGLLGDNRISAATNDFVYALQLARSEAIKRAAPTELCASAAPLATTPDCNGASYVDGWIVFADLDGNGAPDAAEPVLLQTEGPGGGVSFAPSATLAARVRFDAAGTSISDTGAPQPGAVTIALPDGESRVVNVRANGRIGSSAP